MIKYECDMCHKIFDDKNDIYVCEMPRNYQYYGGKSPTLKLIIGSTDICKDCAKKIADMMDIVVDK